VVKTCQKKNGNEKNKEKIVDLGKGGKKGSKFLPGVKKRRGLQKKGEKQ